MKEESRSKFLLKNTFIFAIGNFATKFISFFLIPLYTNVLTVEEYGIIDLLYTICTVLIPFFTLNISEAILRFSMDKAENENKIMSIGLVFCCITVVIGIITIPILRKFETYRLYTYYFYFYLISLSISQICTCNLRGSSKLIEYSIANVIQTLSIGIFNILFLVVFKFGICGYFSAYIISNIIVIVYSMYKGNVFRILKSFEIDNTLLKEMVKYSSFLIPTTFMWWIINSSDRIILTKMMGHSANGIFAISYKLPTLLSTITTIFTQAWLYSAVNEKDSDDKEEYTNKIYKILFAVVAILAAGMLMIIKPFLKFYVSEDYYVAWRYVPFLTIGFLFLTLATFVSTSYSVYKDSKGMLKSGMIGAIINIIFNYLLIPNFGIYGAAFSTAFSYFVVYVYRVFDTKKYLKIKILDKKSLIIFSLLIIMICTEIMDNIYGQCLLIIEFIMVLLFLGKEILFVAKKIFNRKKEI